MRRLLGHPSGTILGFTILVYASVLTFFGINVWTSDIQLALLAALAAFTVSSVIMLLLTLAPLVNKYAQLEVSLAEQIDSLSSRLVSSVGHSEVFANPLLRPTAEYKIAELQTTLNGIPLGVLEINSLNIMQLAAATLLVVKESIVATTYIKVDVWWGRSNVQEYYLANVAAVSRGVNVTRIFMFGDEPEAQNGLDILNQQAHAGINVRVIYLQDVPPEDQVDFAIFDNELAWHLRVAPDRTSLLGFTLYASETKEFGILQQRASRLMELSIPFDRWQSISRSSR